MRMFLFFLCFLSFLQLNFSQSVQKVAPDPEAELLPIRYLDHLEINGLIPLKTAPNPNHLAFDVKYWLNQTPVFNNSFGFAWQMGFNEGYAESDVNFVINNLEGNELAYLYNYLSLRYRAISKTPKFRPYAELGIGWLWTAHNFVDRPLNPEYDPNHSCPDGTNEFLRETRLIRNQHRLALEGEVGVLFQVNEQLGINFSWGGLFTNRVAALEQVPAANSILENGIHTPPNFRFNNRILQSTHLKVGLLFTLFNDPNCMSSPDDDDDDDCSSSSIFDGFGSCN